MFSYHIINVMEQLSNTNSTTGVGSLDDLLNQVPSGDYDILEQIDELNTNEGEFTKINKETPLFTCISCLLSI